MNASRCETPSNSESAEGSDFLQVGPTEEDLLNLVFEAGLIKDCRRSPRRKIQIGVTVIPVNEQGRALGPPFVAESRNLSASGICLVHTEPVAAEYLMVEIPGAKSVKQQVAVQIARCNLVNGLYEIAGPFVTLGGANGAVVSPMVPHS